VWCMSKFLNPSCGFQPGGFEGRGVGLVVTKVLQSPVPEGAASIAFREATVVLKRGLHGAQSLTFASASGCRATQVGQQGGVSSLLLLNV